MTETPWHCPAGHPISAADRFDLWCPTCGGDVIAIGARQSGEPPEYQPDEDDLADARQAAMETPE